MPKFSIYKAPNGTHFEQNDIDYLLNNGYSLKDALAELAKCDKYLEPVKEKKHKKERFALFFCSLTVPVSVIE